MPHYRRAIDHTTLLVLDDVSLQQSQPTEETKKAANRLIDYVSVHPNVCIKHYSSDIILWRESDVACLVFPGAKSRISGHYHLSDHSNIVLHPMPPIFYLFCCRLRSCWYILNFQCFNSNVTCSNGLTIPDH